MSLFVAVLPGLLVAAVAWLLRATMKRWFDEQPASAWLVYGALVVVLFGKALFLGAVLLPLDLLANTPPWKAMPPIFPTSLSLQWDLVQDFAGFTAEHHRLVVAGEWPLVAREIGAGQPFLADLQVQHLHPFTLLTDLLPPASAPGVVAALKLLFALVFFGALLRRIGLSGASALGGSLAYGLSGFFMLYLGWPHTHSAAAFPMVCYALQRCLTEGGKRDALLMAVGWTLLVAGGHPETVVYVAIGTAIFGLACLVAVRGLGASVVARRLGRAAIGALLGVAITAPTLLPFLMQVDQSSRAWHNRIRVEGIRSGRNEHPATPDLLLKRSLPIVAPLAFGSELYGESWGYASIIQEGASFAGTAALCGLALWLLLLPRGGPRYLGEGASWAMLAIGLLFVIQPPGLVRWMVDVPLLGSSGSENRRLALFVCFALAFLGACSWERLQRSAKRPSLWLLIAPIGVAGLVVWGYAISVNPAHPAIQAGPRMAARQLQLGVAAAMALTLALCRHPDRWRQRLSSLRFVFPLLIGLELFQLHGVFSPAMPRDRYFPPTESTDFLRENLGSSRMLALGGVFQESYPLVLGIADLRSSSPLRAQVLDRLTRRLRAGTFSRDFVVADDPLLDLLAVRYVATEPGQRLEPALRLVAEDSMAIWERPRAMNLVFVARRARRLGGDDWAAQLEQVADFHTTTLVDSLPTVEGDVWRARSPRENRVLSLEDAPAHVRTRLDCSEACLMATSLYQDGGWRVLIDGERVEPARTNGLFVGVWAPAGEHVVDLVYRPPGFLGGSAVCAVALLFGGVWWRWPERDPASA